MENNFNSVIGFAVTGLLYIFSKIAFVFERILFINIDLGKLASAATILSGMTVVLINVPKIVRVYSAYVKPIFKKGGRK